MIECARRERMRFSFESRCRLVSLVLAGDESAGGRGRLRCEPRDRLSALASLPGGRLGGACATGRRCRGASRDGCRRSSSSGSWRRAPTRKAGPLIVAGLLGLPASTVWKVLRRYGVSRLPRAAARAGRSATSASGRASSCTSTSSGSAASGRSGKRDPRRPAQPQPPRRLAVPAPRDRRPLAARLRRAAPEREPGRLRRLPAPRRRLVRRARDHRRARPQRQRQRLPLARLGEPPAPSSRSRRRYTRPRRPQTNGKAEALVKTLLREWAYRFAYPTSAHRARALPGYLRWYNRHRPHSSLGGRPPISRVSQVCGSHS